MKFLKAVRMLLVLAGGVVGVAGVLLAMIVVDFLLRYTPEVLVVAILATALIALGIKAILMGGKK